MPQAGPSATPLPWRAICLGPLVAGLSFGVAYGVTQRLVTLNVGELIRFGPGFDVQVFPGTSLDSLRLRFGDRETQIWADLDLQELERQQQQEAQARAKAAQAADQAAPLEAEAGLGQVERPELAPAAPEATPLPLPQADSQPAAPLAEQR